MNKVRGKALRSGAKLVDKRQLVKISRKVE